jgi:Fe-Mn family superoxide dismutase
MFELPNLKYEYNALEPFVDAKTMEIHHSKHHQGYINKLNAALESHADKKDMSLSELLLQKDSFDADLQKAVQNHAGGHYNHCLFFDIMSPNPGQMSSELKSQIESDFGSQDNMIEEFFNAAASVFGSGWAWLVKDKDGHLTVQKTANQDTPLTQTQTPILGIDVWEHAYYLKYQNKRPDYIKAFMSVLDWQKVSDNFKS